MHKYRFAFDRNKLIMLLGGAVLSGVLMFAAGILIGLALTAPSRSELAMLRAQNVAQQAAAKAAPVQPAVQPAAQTPAAVAPPQVQAQAPASMPQVQAQALAATPPVMAPTVVTPAIQTVAAPIVTVMDVSSASGLGTAIPTEKDVFSLQIGAYPDAKAARELQTDLRERGYPAAIFTGVDSERKEWHAVRIGGFATLGKASAAAAAFTGKERLQALIRPSDTL
jgi:cell division protein FtsN